MSKATDLAKKIMKAPEENWLLHLEDVNLHVDFGPIYKLGYSQKISNTITVFIILSYDSSSEWINLNRDRYEDKIQILKGIGLTEKDGTFNSIFKPILEYENDEVQEVIVNFLLNHTDHRWQEIHSLLDYATKNIRYTNKRTSDKLKTGTIMDDETKQLEDTYQDIDEKTMIMIRTEKGKLLATAIDNRRKADEILIKIKADFVKTDHAVQSDFGFSFTDTAKEKIDFYSWRQYIRNRNNDKVV